MKIKRVLMMIFACVMLMGQIVFAEGNSDVPETEMKESSQQLGAECDIQAEFLALENAGETIIAVLTEQGQLWEVQPDFVLLDENVQTAEGAFMLKTTGELIRIDSGNVVMEDVVDVCQRKYMEDNVWKTEYAALKENGELWKSDDEVAFQKMAEGVREISSWGYLTEEDILWDYAGWSRENVEYILENGYYVQEEGFFLHYQSGEDKKISTLKVKDYGRGYYGKVTEENMDWEHWAYDLILTQENEVWAIFTDEPWGEPTGETQLLSTDGAKLCMTGFRWDWKDKNGTYYLLDNIVEPTVETPFIIKQFSSEQGYFDDSYQLWKEGLISDDSVYKNGTKVLDDVTELFGADEMMVALRSDGTIWDVAADTPVLLGRIENEDSCIKGDVNGDQAVDIQDLRMILRYVCGKTELTEQQLKLADVIEDGTVDIQDLRKVLRFVCGKIETL